MYSFGSGLDDYVVYDVVDVLPRQRRLNERFIITSARCCVASFSACVHF